MVLKFCTRLFIFLRYRVPITNQVLSAFIYFDIILKSFKRIKTKVTQIKMYVDFTKFYKNHYCFNEQTFSNKSHLLI